MNKLTHIINTLKIILSIFVQHNIRVNALFALHNSSFHAHCDK